MASAWSIFVHFSLNTGFRKSEALGLRWKDIDFKKIMAKETDFSIKLSQPGHMNSTNSRNPALIFRTPKYHQERLSFKHINLLAFHILAREYHFITRI